MQKRFVVQKHKNGDGILLSYIKKGRGVCGTENKYEAGNLHGALRDCKIGAFEIL